MKGKTGAGEMFSELVTIFSKYELPSEKKWLGLLVTGLRL
jgi:hypothetical protein